MKDIIVFDVETTAIPASGIQGIERIHCIAATNVSTMEHHFADAASGYATIMKILKNAHGIVAHNLLGFDLPVLKKFFPDWEPEGQLFDTLVMCRAMWHDVANKDFGRCTKGTLPRRLLGSHSLEAYGYRMGILKGEYCKQENAWDHYSEEMAEYCRQDTAVLVRLYDRIMKAEPSEEMIELENRFAAIMFEQEQRGVGFDTNKAIELMAKLRGRKDEINKELQLLFPPKYEPVEFGKTFTATCKRKTMPGLEKGMEFCKIKLTEFNPGSRQQIAERLIKKYNWSPDDVTDKGTPQINETVLASMPWPEARMLEEYLTVNKRLSQLADGNQAWLKKVIKGRIHGRVNSGGTISGRCSHSNPNLAQVPSVGSPFGEDCRGLFCSSPGYSLVGCDASGLELRCLAHYLAAFDNGEYADIVLNGDIHSANQNAAGLPTRNMAKTFIYGWLYGAGVAKIGKIVDGDAAEGTRLQKRFMTKFPAIKKLKDGVEKAVQERGYIKGLDGRRMRTRSPHSALNLLLQGAGALLMKRFAIELYDATKHLDRHFVINCHDEIQAEVRPEHVEEYKEACLAAFRRAGEYFKFRIRIDGDVKVGDNWRETH